MWTVPQEFQTITDRVEYLKRKLEEMQKALRPRPTLRLIQGGKRG